MITRLPYFFDLRQLKRPERPQVSSRSNDSPKSGFIERSNCQRRGFSYWHRVPKRFRASQGSYGWKYSLLVFATDSPRYFQKLPYLFKIY